MIKTDASKTKLEKQTAKLETNGKLQPLSIHLRPQPYQLEITLSGVQQYNCNSSHVLFLYMHY
jgi:hypothetical protein